MAEQQVSAQQWYEKFAQEVGGQAPSEDEVSRVLELAGKAAHASERIAAPVACWIAGREGIELSEAIKIAERLEP